jgi:hypothetical protein
VPGDTMSLMRATRCWVFALTLTTACGPVAYINQVTRDASTKVARAKELEAEKYSPYWYTRATVYLHMAREVAAHADFQGANHFGRLSAEAADKAIFEVENPEKRPHYETADKPIAPAKVDEDTDKVAPAKE